MGSSTSRLLILISLILNSFSAFAQLVNTTHHSTHPQIIYAPESNCFQKCTEQYDPFTMTTYVDPSGSNRTFFQTSSWGNDPHNSKMKRRVEANFYGRAVYVYGPPRAKLDNRPGHIQILLDGVLMATVDLEATYKQADYDSLDPQLMYFWEGIGGDAFHALEITLLDAGSPIRGFGFDSLVATSLEIWQPPKYELSEFEQMQELEIHDTNFATTFTPSYAWMKESSRSAEVIRTFHGTSNELAYKPQALTMKPVAEFPAQCAELKIYGASPAQLEGAFPEGFRHGHLKICRDQICEYVDAHLAYLNVPRRLWNEPVLLYSNDRMPPKVSQTVTMRLLDSRSLVGHRWVMSFSHAVCSQVVPKWPVDGNSSTHSVRFDQLGYTPSYLHGYFSPWTWMDRYGFASAKPYSFFGILHNMPSWSTTVRGHDIKIYVPSPARFPGLRYANVRCCIDGQCHYPDIERWLTGVTEAHSDVLLVHYQDLDPFQDHLISMTAVRRNDEVGDKFVAVSGIVYQQVPRKDDGNTTVVVVVIALAFVMFVGGCFAYLSRRRLQLERRPLLDPTAVGSPSSSGPSSGSSRSNNSSDFRRLYATYTDSSISPPPPYCATSLPQSHDRITVPAVPPPRWAEREAPLNAIPTRGVGFIGILGFLGF